MTKIGIILGSGLHLFANKLEERQLLLSHNSGIHQKRIYTGYLNGKRVTVFQGRNHYYEGLGNEDVLFNVNFAAKLGVEVLIITNAAGGLNPNFRVSELMLITSHINLLMRNFPIVKNVIPYNSNLIKRIKHLAVENNIKLHSGTYCASIGPMYETRSEIAMYRKYNIDAVGMSTIPEILYSRSIGINVIAISCITNLLKTNNAIKINHSEVVEAGKHASNNLSKLIKLIINDY
ncbi:MAG: purine-nucleoside phosphorylase [Ignavibacteria bacterium]